MSMYSAVPEGGLYFKETETQKSQRKVKTIEEKVLKKLSKENHTCLWNSCNQVFETAEQLKDHVEDHIGKGLKTYKCEWDGCDFGERKKRDHMKSHVRKHHKFVGFYCSSCGEGFVRDQELRKHICSPSATSQKGSSPNPQFHSETESSSPGQVPDFVPASFPSHSVPLGVKRSREEEEDEINQWFNSVNTGQVDPIFSPEMVLGLDSLMNKLEADPESFDSYSSTISQCYPFFKKVKQSCEELQLQPEQPIEELFDFDSFQANFPSNVSSPPSQFSSASSPSHHPSSPSSSPSPSPSPSPSSSASSPFFSSVPQQNPHTFQDHSSFPNVEESLFGFSGNLSEDFKVTFASRQKVHSKQGEQNGGMVSFNSYQEDNDSNTEEEEEEEEEEIEEDKDEIEVSKALVSLSLGQQRRRPMKIKTVKQLLDFLETMVVFGGQ